MKTRTPTAEKWVEGFNQELLKYDTYEMKGYSLQISPEYKLELRLNDGVIAILGPQTGEVMTGGLRSCNLTLSAKNVNAKIIYELLTRGMEILWCIKWELEENVETNTKETE